MEAFFTNDYDILPVDDQDLDLLLKGFGVIDSTVKPQSQLLAHNQNALPNKALTQDNILEPFQYSSGILNSNDLPNETFALNFQTPATCSQNMDSSINNGQQTRIQADLEVQIANINTCTKTEDNKMSDQAFEDIWNIIEDDQNGIVGVNGCQDTQEVMCDSVNDSQIPLSVHAMIHENIQQQNSNVFTTLNTVNQSSGVPVALNMAPPNFFTKQAALSTLSPINQINSEDKCKFLQITDSKPAINSPVAGEGYKPFQNSTVILNSYNLSNNVAAVNPNVIHVTWQNDTGLTNQAPAPTQQIHTPCTQNIGPLKTTAKRTGIVGRCPQGVLPLYCQPEPENEEDKMKWRRAKTAHGHRMSKKNALVNDANTIKDLMEEMNELKNQLNIVITERDSYKNTLNNLVSNGPKY